MSDEVQTLKDQIQNLQKELHEAKQENSFTDLKEQYEKVIEDKNKEIAELTKSNQLIQEKMDNTVDNLNDEVKAKLQMAEQLQDLNKTVEELVVDKAEATVDTFIQQGKILPAQRETALKLCLSDNDTFLDLYKDAKPIIDTTQAPKARKVNDSIVDGLKDYFKN
jgi:predicted RNase H-like nuclease (RuvC/YqgF family)